MLDLSDQRVEDFPKREGVHKRVWQVPKKGIFKEQIEKTIKVALKRIPANYQSGQEMAKPGTLPDAFALKMRYMADKLVSPNGIDPHMFLGTYELEREVIVQTANLLNHPAPQESAGFMLSGGTESIAQMLWTYRNKYYVERSLAKEPNKHFNIRTQGIYHVLANSNIEEGVILSPINSHFAIQKTVDFSGIGTNNIILYDLDESYHPDKEDLKEKAKTALDTGKQIIINYITFGDTERGILADVRSVDNTFRKLLRQYDYSAPTIVDSAAQYLFGAVMASSKKYGRKMPVWDFRIPNVKAIIADPHKNQINYNAGMILFRNFDDIRATHVNASYLHRDLLEGVNSLDEDAKKNAHINSSFPTSRSGSSGLATWSYYLSNGLEGLQKKKEKLWEIVQLLRNLITESKEFKLICEPESALVAFYPLSEDKHASEKLYRYVNRSNKHFYYISRSKDIRVRTTEELELSSNSNNFDFDGLHINIMEHNTTESVEGIFKELKDAYEKLKL